MKDTLEYLLWGIYNKYLIKTGKIERVSTRKGTFGRKPFLVEQDGNGMIGEMLCSESPVMVARYGSTELAILRQEKEVELGIRKNLSNGLISQFVNCAGFFPRDICEIKRFSQLMLESENNVDILGVWMKPVNPMENYFVHKYINNVTTTPLRALEPWYHENPWSYALKGKKVLVVHPFEDTIKRQYEKRELIYSNGLLPEFDLHTVKAVQTIAGQKDARFKTWFEALDYMYEECMKIDFDIAIIGCGAYGFPLAAKIKKSGKKAIHLGGATQLLFGIKGKRWDNMPEISSRYNEYWTRPNENETVANSSSVENGCYW